MTGPLIVRKHRPTDAELLDHFASRLGFIEGLTSLDGYPEGRATEPYSYQRTLLTYDGWLVWIATRQAAGKSMGFAMDACAGAMLYDRRLHVPPFDKSPYLDIFVSRNLDDDKEKMGYVETLLDSLPLSIKPKLPINNTLEKEFDNGARIVCMHVPRGKGPARVKVDEVAFIPDQEKVWTAVMGVVTLGGDVRAASTPLRKGDLFHELVFPKDEKTARKTWKLMETPWWLCPALCVNPERAALEAPKMHTTERVRKFGNEQLNRIFDSPGMTIERFQREFECAFVDSLTAFFPWEVLIPVAKCEHTPLGVECPDRTLAMYTSPSGFAPHKRGDVFGGFDVGRHVHASEMLFFEMLGNRLYQRTSNRFEKTPFGTQEAAICAAIDLLHPVRFAIDADGLGEDLSERLVAKYGGIVEGVKFSHPEKDRMATIGKKALEDKNVFLSSDRAEMQQWNSIERIVTASGNFVYRPDENEAHHADKAWAGLLAISRALGFRAEVCSGAVAGPAR